MWNLLYKELRLAAHPNLFAFTLLGTLVIVPSYPYGMVFLFGCMAPFITFLYGRETNDIYYTALLPIPKGDIVKGKCLLVAAAQLAQMLLSLPFALLRGSVLPQGNVVGIEANVAYYGFGFLVYGVFDWIFLTRFFKNAYSVGTAFLWGILPAALLVAAMEVLVHLPGLSWLDSLAPEAQVRQLPILLGGLALYAVLTAAACRVSTRRFLRVDL
jgi:hypothetical protein